MKRMIAFVALSLFGVACGQESPSSPAVNRGVVSGGYDSGSSGSSRSYDWDSSDDTGASDSGSDDGFGSYGDTDLGTDDDTSSDGYPDYDGYDLDCADIGHSVQVDGDDPHGLDADGDGIGCESW